MTKTTKRAGEKEQEQVIPPTTKGKGKENPKGTKTRNAPQASSSQAPSQTRKDKQKMVEPSDPDDESENEEGPSTKLKKTIKKKKAPTKPPTSSQRLMKLKSIPFAPTGYPDHGFLQEAGLFEDVQDIFANLGLGKFFTMAYPTQVDPT
ncbi:unnamed protein product [Arabidopsis arenosa]|uniref:Arabidopsis retrotransposon Orf1 C-terminal domain-containing protein n=1 Tax=Arabidopsis arenosa TaxID=38785 RepID=A0A8S1ZXX0_ARAAE|nr:unnamed protein product [Arabidopsis arenosa]